MFNIVKNGVHTQYGVQKLVADFESDVVTAPTNMAPGSTMFCIEKSTTYILTPQRIWVKFSENGGGGGECDHEYYGDDQF